MRLEPFRSLILVEFQRHVGDAITLVDSAETTAAAVAETLAKSTLHADFGGAPGTIRFFATDSTERFARIGAIFFGRKIDGGDVTLVDLKTA